MASPFINILMSIVGPDTAKVIEQFQQAKINDKQMMIGLLAIALDQDKKTQLLVEEIRGLKGKICDLEGALARKGSI